MNLRLPRRLKPRLRRSPKAACAASSDPPLRTDLILTAGLGEPPHGGLGAFSSRGFSRRVKEARAYGLVKPVPPRVSAQGALPNKSMRWERSPLDARHTGERRYPGGAAVLCGLDSGFRRNDGMGYWRDLWARPAQGVPYDAVAAVGRNGVSSSTPCCLAYCRDTPEQLRTATHCRHTSPKADSSASM